MLRENSCFIILNVKYFWHSTIFENNRSHSLQKFFSSFSSFSLSIFVRFHDCRIRYELYTFRNKSSKSRILSIDERRKINKLIVSKRNWKKTKNNVTSVHRFQHLKSIFDQSLKLTFLSYHIEIRIRISLWSNLLHMFCQISVVSFSLRYSRVVM